MIAIGCDHGGINLKKAIMKKLDEMGEEYKDFGTYTEESCDYPDIAKAVCGAIVSGECDKGILICGTGIGMSMAANKIKGIRAAHITDSFSARMTKEHNDANVICMGERITGVEIAYDMVEAYLNAEFQGGRHAVRVGKIEE
ncbi:MAG: ribose 5-phosphate isomerase B [Ruminococcaceae bacterium]|nr:ribose 5-phosphate isomerase B [Oscillospiraceae bacterium]